MSTNSGELVSFDHPGRTLESRISVILAECTGAHLHASLRNHHPEAERGIEAIRYSIVSAALLLESEALVYAVAGCGRSGGGPQRAASLFRFDCHCTSSKCPARRGQMASDRRAATPYNHAIIPCCASGRSEPRWLTKPRSENRRPEPAHSLRGRRRAGQGAPDTR